MRECIPIVAVHARRTRPPVRPAVDPIRTTARYNQVVRVTSTAPDPAALVLQSAEMTTGESGMGRVRQTPNIKQHPITRDHHRDNSGSIGVVDVGNESMALLDSVCMCAHLLAPD